MSTKQTCTVCLKKKAISQFYVWKRKPLKTCKSCKIRYGTLYVKRMFSMTKNPRAEVARLRKENRNLRRAVLNLNIELSELKRGL